MSGWMSQGGLWSGWFQQVGWEDSGLKQCPSVFVPIDVHAGPSPWAKTVSGYFQLAAVAGRAVIKRASSPDAWEQRSS